jgi:uncharacterized protein (TIGR03083 family)
LPPDTAAAYLAAVDSFADLVAELPAPLDGRPGLGDWDLRALVGHTSRSLVTVLDYLPQTAERVDLDSAAAYYLAIDGKSAGPGVVERGVVAGQALGADPAAAVRDLADRVRAALTAADPERVIPTFAGGSRLRDYLPTRTFELVVHGLDIAAAVPVRWTPPPAALSEAVALATEVAVRRGEGTILLRLITGREPGGFSIV